MSVKRYLRSFANHTAYNEYINGSDVILPNVSYCEQEDEVHYNPRDYSKEYLTFEAVTAGTVTIKANNASVAKTISYSVDDGNTWTDLTTSTTEQTLATLSGGNKLLVKGENTTYSNGKCNTFGGTAQVKVYGNIMSLIYGDNFIGQTTLDAWGYTFNGLFNGYSNLISAENLVLPATTLAEYCYHSMFGDCTSLVTAPELPATTLANACYQNMFGGCTSLVTAPELPATTLADNCYYDMFYDCTSLASAPVLPATTLEYNCYTYMFYGCTSLNYIKAMFTTTPSEGTTREWVNNVASTGTFVKNSAATWNVTGINGIPEGWTVETASV